MTAPAVRLKSRADAELVPARLPSPCLGRYSASPAEAERRHAEALKVFGSVVRGEDSAGSDIDFLGHRAV